MDYKLTNELEDCFMNYSGKPENAYEILNRNLSAIDFEDDDDVEALIQIIQRALTFKDENTAVGDEGLKLLKFLIEKGFDLNFKLLKKKCLILKLADYCWISPEVFGKVVKLGADVYSVDSNFNGVLTLAAKREHDAAEALAVYIAENYDLSQLNCPDQYGITPLMYAVITHKKKLFETLLKCGADVNAGGNQAVGGCSYWMKMYKVTPFALACREGDYDMAKALLDAGADETARDADGIPASFSLAFTSHGFRDKPYFYTSRIIEQKSKIVALLKNTEVTDTEGNTLLMKLMRRRDYGRDKQVNPYDNYLIMQTLIKNGANVNAVNNKGERPIHIASDEFNTVLKDLLDAGADVDAQDNNGNTALIFECKNSDEKNARLLLRRGANFKIKNNNGETAADIAAKNGLADVLELMI